MDKKEIKKKDIQKIIKKHKRSVYDEYNRENDSWSNGSYDDDYTRTADIHYDREDY